MKKKFFKVFVDLMEVQVQAYYKKFSSTSSEKRSCRKGILKVVFVGQKHSYYFYSSSLE